jgi:hypothetical protein
VRNLAIGSSYLFRVRARDAADNWSTWSETTQTYRLTHISDRSSSVSYTPSWKKDGSSSATTDTLMTTTSTGARARYTFTSKGIAVVMPRSSTRGWVEVRIDGTYVGKYSLWASSLKARQTIFSRSWSTTAARTIELRAVTSSSRRLVSLDAFLVTR